MNPQKHFDQWDSSILEELLVRTNHKALFHNLTEIIDKVFIDENYVWIKRRHYKFSTEFSISQNEAFGHNWYFINLILGFFCVDIKKISGKFLKMTFQYIL